MPRPRNGARRRPKQRFFEPSAQVPRERAILAGVYLTRATGEDTPSRNDRTGSLLRGIVWGEDRSGTWSESGLDELARLADTAGAEVVGRLQQVRLRPDVRTFLGRGKAQLLREMVGTFRADLVLFDNDLTPAQGRNLEKLLGCRVLDRTELILDIFARHARTRQARLQVELAQYEYLLPRLARMWKHLERQAGGIGTRGPGETQIETDRRIIRRRIGRLRRELAVVDRRMVTQHKRRLRQYRVALVGYTNAGKSSLMNQLTGAGVYVQDQLFATLDATTRRVKLPGGRVFLLTDTVGFLRKLPHHLVESFRATLSEVQEADLLLHVVDASAPDMREQIDAVQDVLASVCDGEPECVLVFNKMDLRTDAAGTPGWQERVRRSHAGAVFTSAITGEGLDGLRQEVARRLEERERDVLLRLPSDQSRSLARVHELSRVLRVDYANGSAEMRVRVDGRNFGQLVRLPGVNVIEVVRRRTPA